MTITKLRPEVERSPNILVWYPSVHFAWHFAAELALLLEARLAPASR